MEFVCECVTGRRLLDQGNTVLHFLHNYVGGVRLLGCSKPLFMQMESLLENYLLTLLLFKLQLNISSKSALSWVYTQAWVIFLKEKLTIKKSGMHLL